MRIHRFHLLPVILPLLLTALLVAACPKVCCAADTPAFWPREVGAGTSVTYVLNMPESSQFKEKVRATIRIMALSGERYELEYTFAGVGTNLSVHRENLDPARLLGLAQFPAASLGAQSEETEFTPAALGKPLPARRTFWPNETQKTELVRCAEIPFGLARMQCGEFVLEVESFEWGRGD